MIRKMLNMFKKSKPTSAKKQASRLVLSKTEKEEVCQIGIIGLEGIWDVYDMWI